MKRTMATVFGVAAIFSALTTAAIMAADISENMNYKGEVNFDQGAILKIKGVQVTATAAQLNAAGGGSAATLTPTLVSNATLKVYGLTGQYLGNVTAATLTATGAVTIAEGMLTDSTIVAADIKDGEVGTAEIATDGVGAAEIAADSVGSSEIIEAQGYTFGSISTTGAVGIAEGKLTDSTVVSADIKDGEIVNADINGSAAIDVTKLGTGGVIPANSMASLTNASLTLFAGKTLNFITVTNMVYDGGVTTANVNIVTWQ